MFERIDALITKHGFAFQSWDDRYSKGVWACLAPNEYLLDAVRESTSDGDLDMIPATEYFMFTDWLPLVTGRTFVEALTELEKRLAALPPNQLGRGSDWSGAVFEALEHLRDVRSASSSYGGTDGKFDKLPEAWADVAAKQEPVAVTVNIGDNQRNAGHGHRGIQINIGRNQRNCGGDFHE